jgi:hypothetical protein
MKTMKLGAWLVLATLASAFACDNGADLGSDGAGGDADSMAGQNGTAGNQAESGAAGRAGSNNGGSGNKAGSNSGGSGNKAGSSSGGSAEAGFGGAVAGEAGASAGGDTGGPLGAVCETSGDTCGTSLACCYPCGMQGCDRVCTVPCDESAPGCANGCLQLP